ncbi:putative phage antitermination protein Q [Yersinia frederiksenii]|nr:putative phage antitermination protein Q [Yersinia frederiksenii]
MNRAIGIVIAVLVVIVSALFFNSYHLSNQVKKTEAELVAEQATNTALSNIIDAYQVNEAANRVATARQLDKERKLRNESEDRLKRFLAASSVDECAIQRMPDASINILRE